MLPRVEASNVFVDSVCQPIFGFFLVMCSACALRLFVCSMYHVYNVVHTTSVTFTPAFYVNKLCGAHMHQSLFWPVFSLNCWKVFLYDTLLLFLRCLVMFASSDLLCLSMCLTSVQSGVVGVPFATIGTPAITDRTRHLNISRA